MRLDKTLIYKKDGVTTNSVISREDLLELKEFYESNKRNECEGHHLCWSCANGHPDKCDKIKTSVKKDITKYDFITDGYQVVNDNRYLEKFIVRGCKNYKEEVAKTYKTNELVKLRQELKKIYFGTETIGEAHIIQDDLVKRGNIVNVRGARPSERFISELRVEAAKEKTKVRR